MEKIAEWRLGGDALIQEVVTHMPDGGEPYAWDTGEGEEESVSLISGEEATAAIGEMLERRDAMEDVPIADGRGIYGFYLPGGCSATVYWDCDEESYGEYEKELQAMDYHFIEGLHMSLESGDNALTYLSDGSIIGIAKDMAKCHEIRADEERVDYWDADDIDTSIAEHIEAAIEALCKSWWRMFGDVPINDDDGIDEPFMGWPRGTDRFEVWHWFDAVNPGGVKELTVTD